MERLGLASRDFLERVRSLSEEFLLVSEPENALLRI